MRITYHFITLHVLCLLATPLFSQHNQPLPDPLPYWIEAMDQENANYFKAIHSFESFWKDKEMPGEDFEAETETTTSHHMSEEDEQKRAAGDALFFQTRRFWKWAFINKSFVRRDSTISQPDDRTIDVSTNSQSTRSTITADWTAIGPNSSQMDSSIQMSRSGRMCQLKFHPHQPEKLYAVSGSGGLFVSNDNGVNWHVTGTDALPFGYQPASVCIDYTNDQVIYLGMGDANYASQGHGVWKSLDGGVTWFDSNGGMGNRIVYEILMSPLDHSILIAATDNGIWKSTDEGVTWQLKQSIQGDSFLEMKPKPGSATILHACTYSRYFRSDDGGDTWTQITDGIKVPSYGGRGMRLAVSDADPEVVYLGMLSQHGTVFKSTNGGSSFQMMYQDTVTQSMVTYTHQVNGGSNGNYNFCMAADALNADIVYFGTQTLWKSTDGGAHWSALYYYLSNVHPDIHDLKFSPVHHGLFNMNDGGIALSMDDGATWFQHNDGIIAAEIYNAGQSPIRQDMMIIGTQDNGALVYRKDEWFPDIGGDVFDRFWFDYHTPDKFYSSLGNSQGLESRIDYFLQFPLTVLGNRKMIFTPLDTNVAFLCQNEVWRSTDINAHAPNWTKITVPLSASSSDFIRDMAVSPADPNELYVVYGNDQILHSQNALASVPVFDTILPPVSTLYGQTGIAISKRDPKLIYLIAWKQVFRSTDKGKHWTDITGNLPDANVDRIAHDEYSKDESVYILCGNKVYYRNDSLMEWVDYSAGLPGLAYISDLQVYNDGSRKSLLRAVIYGRGIFESPFYRPEPLPFADFTTDTQKVCNRQPVHFSDLSVDGTSWHWDFEGGIPSAFDGKIPPPVVYETPGKYQVALTVGNSNGEDVNTKNAFIEVLYKSVLPFEEGFEGIFPPFQIELSSHGLSNVRWRQAQLGGFNASHNCAVFDDSYTQAVADMRLNVDLSQSISSELYFDVAYGRLAGNVVFDTLAILVSADCGLTLTTVYKKGGLLLATVPDIDNILTFDPGADGWRTDTVDFSQYDGQENVLIYFRGYGSAGEIMVVDNINIRGATLGISEDQAATSGFIVMPNPSHGAIAIRGKSLSDATLMISTETGEIIYRAAIRASGDPFDINIPKLFKGIYFVSLTVGSVVKTEKVVVQ
jgi:PKD repeat protein/photosystem II stability/assembly factor-like uncharacterized protein